ncbi:MAG: restriction endonuclease subunit S [Bacteroidales bacterium]|nr:restriction endonuclease subunit S [Bacteroidales bacterium]
MKVDKSKWEHVPLAYFLKEHSVKNRDLELNNVFSVTNSKGFVRAEEYFDNTVQSSNLSTYKIVEKGMFAYNPSRINVGSIALLDAEDKVIVSPLYVIFSIIGDLNPHYLLRFLKSDIGIALIRSNTSGSVRESLRFKELTRIFIPVPSLNVQKSIAEELDVVQDIIRGYAKKIEDLDNLARSIFLDMFGDVVGQAELGGHKVLAELGSLKNGLNYDKNESGYECKIIGVGAFKNRIYLDSLENIPTITLNAPPAKDYQIQEGDIIFVRSNGNKDLVGRCMEIRKVSEPLTFSGFCINFRKEDNSVLNQYLLHLLSDKSYKAAYILKSKGIGIQSINQKLIGNLPVPIPPLSLQQEFATKVEAIEKQKAWVREQLADAEMLMKERMQYYFS